MAPSARALSHWTWRRFRSLASAFGRSRTTAPAYSSWAPPFTSNTAGPVPKLKADALLLLLGGPLSRLRQPAFTAAHGRARFLHRGGPTAFCRATTGFRGQASAQ